MAKHLPSTPLTSIMHIMKNNNPNLKNQQLTAAAGNLLIKFAVFVQLAVIVLLSGFPAEAAAESVRNTAADPSPETVVLDVIFDPETSEKASADIYALTINGKAMAWDQEIESAALFCEQSGLPVQFFNGGRDTHEAVGQRISFAGLLDLDSFYLRTGANTTKLNRVDLTFTLTEEPETAIRDALDAYRKIRQKFGDPPDGIRVYNEDHWTAFGNDDIAQAAENMIANQSDPSFVSAEFSNLNFYFARYTIPDSPCLYCVELSLSSW